MIKGKSYNLEPHPYPKKWRAELGTHKGPAHLTPTFRYITGPCG